jgi:hypothetical protein
VNRLNIKTKIWLSIGVFVTGYVLSTILGQVQGLNTESSLRITAEALFPAAQRSQQAESAFQGMMQGFSDAFLMQDAPALERAALDGRQAIESLRAVAAIRTLPAERSGAAGNLASSVEQFLTDAKSTYSALLANPANMNQATQAKMRELASRSDAIKTTLQTVKDQSARDLHQQLSVLGTLSANQRWLALLLFGITLVIACGIVQMTIRRAIIGPIRHVIQGVQEASDQAARASDQMAASGDVVARGAQEQASYLTETSASLEEISTTTRENAGRAGQADGLMGQARRTVERATQAMNNLTTSMDVISKSSKQVAVVLKSIDEIAFNTNILALNAAVEAARAGAVGAGFSVVADEVRSLARRAAAAARSSADIIEKTIGDVSNGVDLVAVARGAFNEVSTTISSGSQVVSQIASSSEEQSRGIAHINQAMSRMEKVTQDNAANAKQTVENASAMITQIEATRKHIGELVAVVGLEHA